MPATPRFVQPLATTSFMTRKATTT